MARVTLDAIIEDCFQTISSDSRTVIIIHAIGGRYYLSTRFHNLTLYSPTSATHLSLTPLSIIHVPCNTSFQYQKGGLGTCPKFPLSLCTPSTACN